MVSFTGTFLRLFKQDSRHACLKSFLVSWRMMYQPALSFVNPARWVKVAHPCFKRNCYAYIFCYDLLCSNINVTTHDALSPRICFEDF